MNDEQLDRLADALLKHQAGGPTFDFISKVASVLCTVAIIYVANQITQLDKNFALMQSTQNSLIAETSALKAIAREPKFTRQDFETNMRFFSDRIGEWETEVKRLIDTSATTERRSHENAGAIQALLNRPYPKGNQRGASAPHLTIDGYGEN